MRPAVCALPINKMVRVKATPRRVSPTRYVRFQVQRVHWWFDDERQQWNPRGSVMHPKAHKTASRLAMVSPWSLSMTACVLDFSRC